MKQNKQTKTKETGKTNKQTKTKNAWYKVIHGPKNNGQK